MFMYLASGCTAATKIEKLPMEDNGRIIVEVENEDYALKLKELWNKRYPNKQSAIIFRISPYMPHKELDADIIWTNDLVALQLTSKLQNIPIQEEYKIEKHLVRKELEHIFVPVCAKGKLFLYNEQTLHEKGKKIEDLESFESMMENHISYYHSHDLDYIYPFIKDGFIMQDKRKQENYPDKEIFSVQIDHYKKLYHDAHFKDDIYLQPNFFFDDTYPCGLFDSEVSIENTEPYKQQKLHYMPMPTWNDQQLHPACVTYGFAVNKKSKYPGLIQAFLEMIKSKEGIQALADSQVSVPLIKEEDLDDFYIFDHTRKEKILAMNASELYPLIQIRNTNKNLYSILQNVDITGILQNYICSKQSSLHVYEEIYEHMQHFLDDS